MTSPRTFTSGPPELPGLIAASVWMKSWMLPWPRPGSPFRRAALGAHDAGGDGERQAFAQRIADRQHPLADPGVVAVAERDGRQVLGVDLEHGHVGVGIGADDLRLELPPVEQAHGDLLGALDHVVVGQDVAVGRDDEPGAAALLDLGLLAEAGEEALHARGHALAAGGLLGPAGTGCRPRWASRARPPRRRRRSGPGADGRRGWTVQAPGAMVAGVRPRSWADERLGRSSRPANSSPSANARATRPPNFSQFNDRADIESDPSGRRGGQARLPAS